MISFGRTRDYKLVRRIVTTPQIYRHLTDDLSPSAEDYLPPKGEGVWYVLAHEEGNLLGLFMFVSLNGICAEVHTCLLPSAWGRSVEASKSVVAWMWEHSQCRRIITNVPRYNRLALRLAKLAGLIEFGINEKSFLKHGTLHDQILLGISKPEV